MFSTLLLLLSLSLLRIASPNPLHIPYNLSGYIPPPINTTTTSNPAPANDRLEIDCDATYGVDLDVLDCRNAISYFIYGSRSLTLIDRLDVTEGENIVPLPFRLMGNSAHCYVQPILLGGVRSGTVTADQIKHAAAQVVSQCAFTPSSGGMARNVGADSNVAIIVGKYQPSVTCRGSIPHWRSCLAILYRMEAGHEERFFGPVSDPRTQIGLPAIITADRDKCFARIFSTQRSDTTSWYELWEAFVAVYSVCARHGLGGYYTGLGDERHLVVSFTGRYPRSSEATNLTLPAVAFNASVSEA